MYYAPFSYAPVSLSYGFGPRWVLVWDPFIGAYRWVLVNSPVVYASSAPLVVK